MYFKKYAIYLLSNVLFLSLSIPLAQAYDRKFDNRTTIDYIRDSRGSCEHDEQLLDDEGNESQNDCENLCDRDPICEGYDFKPGSCRLKKHIAHCDESRWKSVGYTYFSKPTELEISLSGGVITLNPDREHGHVKYCLHVPYNAGRLDKLVSTKCEISGHKGQTFILETIDLEKRQFKIRHLETNLCLDIVQYSIERNPTRLENCDFSGKSDAAKARMTFVLSPRPNSPESKQFDIIPNELGKLDQFKVYFVMKAHNTLPIVPNYISVRTGDCTGNEITSYENLSTSECARKCDKEETCKGYSYSRETKSCFIKNKVVCDDDDRELNGYNFYSKSDSL